jgi:hypothetical protein
LQLAFLAEKQTNIRLNTFEENNQIGGKGSDKFSNYQIFLTKSSKKL